MSARNSRYSSEQEALLAIGHHPEVAEAWAQVEYVELQLSHDVLRQAREDKELMAIAARRAWQSRIQSGFAAR